MLSVIGEAPVNSITGTTTVDVSVAKNILDETSMSIQSQGWNFNTHTNYKSLSLDSNNKVPLPVNCVKADANQSIQTLKLTQLEMVFFMIWKIILMYLQVLLVQ